MRKEDILRSKKERVKNVIISFRVSEHLANWIKQEKFVPRKILIVAVKELGYKED